MTADAAGTGPRDADRGRDASGAVRRLLGSADFARAFTLTTFAALVGSHLIERVAGIVTLRAVVAGLCVFALGILWARREEISLLRLVPTTLLLLVAWAFASVFWSSDPFASLGRWSAMAAVALLAVTIGHIRDTLQTVRALGDVLRAALGLSLGLEVFSGILLDMPLKFLGIQGNIAALGPIQGIFGTRNMLGIITVVAMITFAVEMRTQSVRPGTAAASLTLAAALGLLSASPTVLVLAVAVGTATAVLMLVRAVPAERRRAMQWSLAAVVAAASVAGYVQRARILDALGAADDLSMRTRLWSLAGFYTSKRPVQGWGWFGPWEVDEQPFFTINQLLGQHHTTALNAYVDVLLQLGWAGLLLLCALGGVALVRSWMTASQRRAIVYAWTPLMLVALAVTSVFESVALFGVGWMLLCLCAVRAGQSRSWRDRLTGDVPTGSFSLPR